MALKNADMFRMESRQGGGCLSLCGLPFLAGGLAAIAATLTANPSGPGVAAVMFILGLAFAAVGAIFVFGRAGTVIDKNEGKLKKWWGLLVPFHSEERDLGEFKWVEVSCEERRHGSSRLTVYPVRLGGTGKPVEISQPQDYETARREAENVAKFLEIDMADSSAGERVVRKAASLDESLRERVRKKGQRPELPEPPADMKTKMRLDGDTAVFEIPPRGFTAIHYALLAVSIVFPAIIYFVFFRNIVYSQNMPIAAKAVLGGFIGIVFILMPFIAVAGAAIRGAVARTTVEASPRELRVTVKGILLSRTTSMSADELEELLVGEAAVAKKQEPVLAANAKALLARSDKVTVSFGEGLPIEELEWIKAAIVKVLAL